MSEWVSEWQVASQPDGGIKWKVCAMQTNVQIDSRALSKSPETLKHHGGHVIFEVSGLALVPLIIYIWIRYFN